MSTKQQTAVDATRKLAAKRWRVAAGLTFAIVFVYFGFIILVAYQPALLATVIQDGLSLGILLGALVIVAAWLLTYVYVSWANRVYDPALAALREHHRAATDSGTTEAAATPTSESPGDR